mmetsp:Transcript_20975/g.80885  ORF Transcript_20975/g.80885 Transcript_20975/m.80885 type:complete len:425 (-) Transcript_20975:404-1678(-)
MRGESLVEVQVQRDRRQVLARTGALVGQQLQLQPILGLQLDDQPIGQAGSREDLVRHRPEVDDDLRFTGRQPLAGAQVEGHAGPAPVLHLGAQCDEGLAAAVLGHLHLFEVARHRLAAAHARAVLAAHDIARDALGREGLERAQHLELLVADGVGVVAGRWLHRDHRQQLQRVVLDHVAQRAGAVVERTARADAELLGQRDLDVGDAFAAPQRFEQCVAEAQRHQVLNRRLAEVVVDAEGLGLGEDAAHRAVDLLGTGQVVTQRFFEHHTHLGVVQADRAELLADAGEQVRAGREVEHDGVRVAPIQPVLQALVVVRLGQVHAAVVHQRREALELLVTRALAGFDLAEALLQPLAIALVGLVVARDGENATALRQLAVPEGLEQRGHQLAPGQVAGAAKEHEIERHLKGLQASAALGGAGRCVT